jgi:hypothetical protein
VQPPRPSIPASLFIGLVLGVYSVVTLVATVVLHDFERIERWDHFVHGCAVASLVLVSYGLFTLANRLVRLERVAMTIAAWSMVLVLAWTLARPMLTMMVYSEPTLEYLEQLQWATRGMGALGFLGLVALTIATRAWTRAPVAAVFLLFADMMSGWVPYLGPWLWELFEDHQKTSYAIWVARELVWAGCILWLVWKLPPAPAGADVRLASAGLRRASAAIIVRVIAALAIAVIGLGMLKAPGGAKLLMFAGPAVIVVSLLGCAWGLLGAEAGRLEGMPRIRLVVGAALTAWWAGTQVSQLARLYWSTQSSFASVDTTTWTVGGPLVAMLGLGLVGSAIAGFARHRRDAVLEAAADSGTRLLVVLSVSGAGVQLPFSKFLVGSEAGVAILMALIIVSLLIAALAVMARLLSQTAVVVEQTPGLPTAVVRS